MHATVIVKKADTIDDDFSYRLLVENADPLVLPIVGDYIDVGINASRRVVQRDFSYLHDHDVRHVEITLFVE